MTSANGPVSKSTSRRALLAGALGGLGAWAAAVAGRPSLTRAGVDGDVVLGAENSAAAYTAIRNTTTDADVFYATTQGHGTAIYGSSQLSTGVFGDSFLGDGVRGLTSNGIGVLGTSGGSQPGVVGKSTNSSSGVLGFSAAGSIPIPPPPHPKTGVFGYAAQDSSSFGVIGESPAGIGVYGSSNTNFGGFFAGKVYTTKWYELGEVPTPTAPGANKARLFVRDNGAGKTQLCVRFATGTVKVLATEA
jgi:hypothetical protein